MILLQPWWLLLAPLGSMFILLLHMKRRKEVQVGSVYLWKRVVQRQGAAAATARWRIQLPLLLQVMLVALLAVLLAQPTRSADKDHVVIVVDASVTMTATDSEPTRLEAAQVAVEDYLHRLGRVGGEGTRISVIVANERPYVAATRTTDVGRLAEPIRAIRPSHGSVDWAAVRSRVNSLNREHEATHILVFGDDDRALDSLESSGTPVSFRSFGSDRSNLALTDVAVEPSAEPGEPWRVLGTIRSAEPQHSEPVVQLGFRPLGAQRPLVWESQSVGIGEDLYGTFDFEFSEPGEGVVEVMLSPGDSFAVDDWFGFATKARDDALQVLHVGPDNEPLRRAFEAVGGTRVTRSTALPDNAQEFDLVIVDRVRIEEHPGTSTLWVGSIPVDDAAPEPTRVTVAESTGWDSGHPLARHLDLRGIEVREAWDMSVLAGGSVLLDAGGTPLIQARSTSYGREVVISFALEASSWTERISFPAFAHRLLRWIDPHVGRSVAIPCFVGEECALGAEALRPGSMIVEPNGREMRLGVEVDGEVFSQPPVFVPTHSGVHEVRAGGARSLFVVEPPSLREVALPIAADKATVDRAFQPASPFPWRSLLIAALGILLVETWIARHWYIAPRGTTSVVSTRRIVLMTARVTGLVLILIAISDVPYSLPERRSSAVIVVDQQILRTEKGREAFEQIRDRISQGPPLAKNVATIVVAHDIELVSDMAERERIPDLLEASATDVSDLSTALDVALGTLVDLGPKRVHFVTEDTVSPEDIAEPLRRFSQIGATLDVYVVPAMGQGEVLVELVEVPARVHAGEQFEVEAVVFSAWDTTATVRMKRDGDVFQERELELSSGRTRIVAHSTHDTESDVLYEVEVTSSDDRIESNNVEGAYVRVLPKARVAVFSAQEIWGRAFVEALEVQGHQVDLLSPRDIPYYLGHEHPSIRGWLDYDTVVLMNIPALELQTRQQELLRSWVRDHGGGLLLLGGENTFGPGGYYQSVLEEILPLSTEIPHELPTAAISFVLDRSGSMQQAVGDVSRLDVAKRATLEAIELLDDESQVGIVVFDSEAEILIPMTSAADRGQLREMLQPLRAGGGTSIYPGLELAFDQLGSVDSDITRHIVLMTDGLSAPGRFEALVGDIRDEGISVSTAAIGRGADATLLQNIARWGDGAAHVTDDFEAFPSILAQEMLMLSEEPVQESTFQATWVGQGEAPFGSSRSAPPTLHGYVRTSEKDGAHVHLLGPQDAPLLATWRYGIGQVAAFASHGAGAWSEDWLARSDYPAFWSQLVRWSLQPTTGTSVRSEVWRERDTGRVAFETSRADGTPFGGQGYTLRLHRPGGSEQSIPVRAVAPNQWEGFFDAEEIGTYRIEVRLPNGGGEFEGPNEPEASTLDHALLYVAHPLRDRLTRSPPAGWDAPPYREFATVKDSPTSSDTLGGEVVWSSRNGWPLWSMAFGLVLLIDLTARYRPRWIVRSIRRR